MCTVTIIARKRGYILAMNRDEKLTRARGLPPQTHLAHGHMVISPSEPTGGTWIALNDARVAFALINWYSIKAHVTKQPVSRGEIINFVNTQTSPMSVSQLLTQLPLKQINPFRLIAVFPAAKRIVEWRWNLKKLVRMYHPWRSNQFISSGYDEPQAQLIRSRTFRLASRSKTFGSLDWLRRLHRSHAPGRGPFSTCMHRQDAQTVSYTEILVSTNGALMRYHDGSPCSGVISNPIFIAQASPPR